MSATSWIAQTGTGMTATRRLALAALASASLIGMVPSAFAEDTGNAPKPYTKEAFEAAQKAGQPILVDTFATWCDICKRQMPIIDKLLAEPQYKQLVTFRVNFDTQKDVMRAFNARQQSTLIVFHGTKEVGRSIGDTQEEWIDDLMSKAMVKTPAS